MKVTHIRNIHKEIVSSYYNLKFKHKFEPSRYDTLKNRMYQLRNTFNDMYGYHQFLNASASLLHLEESAIYYDNMRFEVKGLKYPVELTDIITFNKQKITVDEFIKLIKEKGIKL